MADGHLVLRGPAHGPAVVAKPEDRRRTVRVTRPLIGEDALGLADDLAAIPLDRIDHLDLSLDVVDAVDSSGIAAIVRVYGHLARAGGRMRLVNASRDVARALEEVGLHGVIPVVIREE
ncbi:MAG: STAS domain-containing protein [Myxococcota bacterium]